MCAVVIGILCRNWHELAAYVRSGFRGFICRCYPQLICIFHRCNKLLVKVVFDLFTLNPPLSATHSQICIFSILHIEYLYRLAEDSVPVICILGLVETRRIWNFRREWQWICIINIQWTKTWASLSGSDWEIDRNWADSASGGRWLVGVIQRPFFYWPIGQLGVQNCVTDWIHGGEMNPAWVSGGPSAELVRSAELSSAEFCGIIAEMGQPHSMLVHDPLDATGPHTTSVALEKVEKLVDKVEEVISFLNIFKHFWIEFLTCRMWKWRQLNLTFVDWFHSSVSFVAYFQC